MLAFIGATVMLAVVGIFALIQSAVDGKNFAASLHNHRREGLVFAVVTVPILLCYWYYPLFVYHLHMPYDRVHIDFPDFALRSVQLDFFSSRMQSLFLDYSGMDHALKSSFLLFSLETWCDQCVYACGGDLIVRRAQLISRWYTGLL